MPDKELRLAGTGPLYEELDKIANITFLGQVEHNKLMQMIAEAKAVILPSQIYEGFPMTVPEAFSMKTPMIVGDVGNNGVLIKEGYNGLKFRYDSMNSFMKTINRFEEIDQRELGSNAYCDYESKYSSESNYKILHEIYRMV